MIRGTGSLFFGILLFSLFSFVSAVDCPFGLVDESYPGTCGRYIDSNGDGICDLSQDTLDMKNDIPLQNAVKQKNIFGEAYNSLAIVLLLIVFYILSLFAVKRNWISFILHKKIWNFLLLVTFIAVAFTSLVYLLRIDYAFDLNISRIAFWHIEIGIAMIMISLFHAFEHLAYYKTFIKN